MSKPELLVDFIGVGAAKAATSWLAACLAEHPEICMSAPKELHYFCEKMIWPGFRVNRHLGPRWLADRFRHCQPGQRLGEFSPNYLPDSEAPRLIFEHNPKCRLIFCFRHPIEGLVSYYYQLRTEIPLPEDFDQFLREYPSIRRIGLYHTYVRSFLQYFPRNQCLFLFFEDIEGDSANVLKQCFSFLDVEPNFTPRLTQVHVNERSIPRSKVLLKARYELKCRIQRSGHLTQTLIWKLRPDRVHFWLGRRNRVPFNAPAIKSETRQALAEYYRADVDQLAAFLGRDLSDWQH